MKIIINVSKILKILLWLFTVKKDVKNCHLCWWKTSKLMISLIFIVSTWSNGQLHCMCQRIWNILNFEIKNCSPLSYASILLI